MSVLALAPVVREVDLEHVDLLSRGDWQAAVLWCPECAREPWTTAGCDGCGATHRHMDFGPYLDCNRCGADLIWVVIEAPHPGRPT